MNSQDYLPVLVCAVLVFILLSTNPKFLQGKRYGDKPAGRSDPLMTALVVALVGAVAVYLVQRNSLTGGW